MSASALGLVELLLVFGGVLGWAVWELLSVRRALKKDRKDREAREAQAARQQAER